MKVLALGALAIGLSLPSLGHAGGDYDFGGVAEHIFVKADSNEDGVMTRAEHDAPGLPRWGSNFDEFDLNGDGSVSLDEYKTVFLRYHEPGRAA